MRFAYHNPGTRLIASLTEPAKHTQTVFGHLNGAKVTNVPAVVVYFAVAPAYLLQELPNRIIQSYDF